MKDKIKWLKKSLRTKFSRRRKEVRSSYLTFSKKISYLKLMHWTYPKKIFLGILIIFIIGACLLYSPISFNYDSYQYVDNQFVFNFKPNLEDQYAGVKVTEVKYNFVNALFMASSAFTDTGFSVVTIGTNLSPFGQVVMYALVQIGGFGYISLFYVIGKTIRKLTKKNILSSSMLNIERGGTKMSDSSQMIIKIFIVSFIIQFIFSIGLSIAFFSYPFKMQQSWQQLISTLPSDAKFSITINGSPFEFSVSDKKIHNILSLTFDNVYGTTAPTYQNYGLSLWYAMFLTGSSINNAGFDLFGSSSLQIFRNDIGVVIQFLLIILIIIGGIGFPVIYDLSLLFEWHFKHRILYRYFKKREYMLMEKPKLSSFSKMCLLSWIILTLISIGIMFFTEYIGQNKFDLKEYDIQNYFSLINFPNSATIITSSGQQVVNFFGENVELNKNFSIIFSAISARSAGFATVNMANFTEPSIIILSILMFIGASPSSTGGGIRTTTLTVVTKSLLSWFRGLEKTSFSKRKIPSKNVTNAHLVLIVATLLMLVMTLLLYITSEINIDGKNLVASEFKDKTILYSFSYFLFESASAFGTSGLTVGIVNSQYIQWWNLMILIILMFIGQLGVPSTLLIFARKVPKKTESAYLEEDVRLG